MYLLHRGDYTIRERLIRHLLLETDPLTDDMVGPVEKTLRECVGDDDGILVFQHFGRLPFEEGERRKY